MCRKAGHTVSTSRKESETVPGDQFLSLLLKSRTPAHWTVLLTFRKGFPIPVTLIEKITATMPEAYLFSEPRFCRVDINSQRFHFSCGIPVAWNGMS